MASTAVTTKSTFVPSPENHFGVHFGDRLHNEIRQQNAWKNPYASSIIRPYIPSDNTDLILVCNKGFNQHIDKAKTFDSSGAIFHLLLQDAFNITVIYLNPKDIVNFSEVSKCCYLATKANAVWQLQFKNLCPNTTLLSMEKCCFSPEQQFKIYFKRINDELKPYKAQFERSKIVIQNLIGPNGNDGEIAQAQKEFEDLGGNAALSKYINILLSPAIKDGLINANAKLSDATGLRCKLTDDLTDLVGGGYNGTDASIDPNSQLARCQLAIAQLPCLFDDQEKFEQFIQALETAKNNVSESNGEAIPQDAPFNNGTNPVTADFFGDTAAIDFRRDGITHE